MLDRFEHWLFANDGSARAIKPLRYVYALVHDLFRGELTLRAMSLVYTTLLSVVPLIALAFSVLKGLGYHRDLEPVLYQVLEPIGDKAYQITSQVMVFIENIREGVLGSLGLLILLYTSISMIQKVEESFNFVWRVKEPRGIGRRISEYLSALVIGPLLLISMLSILATLSNAAVVHTISAIEPFGRILALISQVTPYVIVAGVFAFLYGLVPNTKVRARAALIGGAVAGVLWALSGAMFATAVTYARGPMLIYAGFAFVILSLFWLYLSWLILLLGAQLAYYVQHPHSLRPGTGVVHLTNSLTERLALSVMHLIAQSFVEITEVKRTRWTLNTLAERLNVAGITLQPVTDRLERAGILVATEDEALVPGRDIETITLAEIFDAARNDSQDRKFTHVRCLAAANAVADLAVDSMRASLMSKTLRAWIDETRLAT